jgi:DNA polymerase-3 subunit beta
MMARSDPPPTVTGLAIKDALKLTGMVVERRNTIPVLSCVRLKAPGLIEATDLDLHAAVVIDGYRLGLPADGILLQQRPLAVAVKDTDGSLTVGGDAKGRFVRVGENPAVRLTPCKDDLPEPAPFAPEVAFELPRADLAADLTDVAIGMSTEETRYYLNGILFHVVDGQLRIAATDGHRLHRAVRASPVEQMPDGIVPRKAVHVLLAALALSNAASVKVEIGALKARFTVGAVTLTTRLIDGVFPDYGRVIPQTAAGGMRLLAHEIVRPATLAARLLGKHSHACVIRPKDATIAAKGLEAGAEIHARLDRELIGEPPEEVGFRHEYLVDSLKPFVGRTVTMAMDGPAAPCRIECEADGRMLVVLMPMRV